MSECPFSERVPKLEQRVYDLGWAWGRIAALESKLKLVIDAHNELVARPAEAAECGCTKFGHVCHLHRPRERSDYEAKPSQARAEPRRRTLCLTCCSTVGVGRETDHFDSYNGRPCLEPEPVVVIEATPAVLDAIQKVQRIEKALEQQELLYQHFGDAPVTVVWIPASAIRAALDGEKP